MQRMAQWCLRGAWKCWTPCKMAWVAVVAVGGVVLLVVRTRGWGCGRCTWLWGCWASLACLHWPWRWCMLGGGMWRMRLRIGSMWKQQLQQLLLLQLPRARGWGRLPRPALACGAFERLVASLSRGSRSSTQQLQQLLLLLPVPVLALVLLVPVMGEGGEGRRDWSSFAERASYTTQWAAH